MAGVGDGVVRRLEQAGMLSQNSAGWRIDDRSDG